MIKNLRFVEIKLVAGGARKLALGEFISTKCECLPLLLQIIWANLTMAECADYCCSPGTASSDGGWRWRIFDKELSGKCYDNRLMGLSLSYATMMADVTRGPVSPIKSN